MNYIPLNVKTDYSFLSSLVTIKELVKKCCEYKISSVAITDTNTMSGVIEFYNECKKSGIKPIIGVDLEVSDFNLLLYAKNINGYNELIRLVTTKSQRNLEISDLSKSDNLIAIINNSSKYKLISDLYKTYLGYLTLTERQQFVKITKNLVFIQEVLFLDSEDAKYLGYLDLIRNQKKINEYKIYPKYNCLIGKVNIPLQDELNMKYISDNCNIEFNFEKNLLPIYDESKDMDKYLTELAHKGLEKRLGNVPQEYLNRLNYELSIIKTMGFTNYFLIVWDYIRYAKKNGILVGPGRGSAASSLVSYSLGIIDIDPIRYNLLFERFLNPGRITMPDIDVDFEDTRRDEVIKYCVSKYGEKNVSGIITFQTMGAKAALRDIGKILDVPVKLIEGIANFVPNTQTSLKDIYNSNKEFQKYIRNNNLYKIYDVSSHIEGIKRQRSVHASGIIISKVPLDSLMPLIKHGDTYITGYPANYLESMGLLKMDFLGIANLTLISKLIKSIRANKDSNFDFNNIPLDDVKTIELFKKANTLGIFQFESEGMRNFLTKLKPDNIEDLICANALFRPGPSMFIDKYIYLKQNGNVKYIDDSLEPILKSTYGIIVYQEQILQIAAKMAGFTLGEADILRSAMSKKKYDILEQEKPKFINGSIKNGYSKEKAEMIYENILKFSSYGFNRAHSVAYTIIAYKMAYIKANYQTIFYVELLNSTSKIKECIYECRKQNICVLKPNVNKSIDEFKLEQNSILYPLNGIKGIGENIVKEILDKREKSDFISFNDFVSRCYSTNIDRKILEILIDSGSLDVFNLNRRTMHENLNLSINYAGLVKEISKEFVDEPIIERFEEYSKDEISERELNVFGFYFNNHPVLKYKNNDYIEIKNIPKYLDKNILVLGMVESIKEIITKNNQKMSFVKISDETDNIDVTVFPEIYTKIGVLNKHDIILIKAKVEKRFSKYQLVVNKLDILNRIN